MGFADSVMNFINNTGSAVGKAIGTPDSKTFQKPKPSSQTQHKNAAATQGKQSSTGGHNGKSCDLCNRTGLAILPVRASVVRASSKAPKLPASLQPNIQLGNLASYTARLMRAGFIYVFDERWSSWDKYLVTADGYLMKMPSATTNTVAAHYVVREPCTDNEGQGIASCISVWDPKNKSKPATKIWVGFSDAEWTAADLQRHASADFRNRHMTEFNVAAWMAGNTSQPGAKPIEQVGALVAEYHTGDARQFTSPYKYNARVGQAHTLPVVAKNNSSPDKSKQVHGAILMLKDPAGVTAEVGALALTSYNAFMSQADRARKAAVSSAIQSLKPAVAEGAGMDLFIKAYQQDDLADQESGGFHILNSALDITKKQVDETCSRAWKGYLDDYNEAARAQWQNEFDAELTAFSQNTLTPLAKIHVKWMASDWLKNYMQCTHDPASPEAGMVYVAVLDSCIQGMEMFGPCLQQYTNWLDQGNLGGGTETEGNLLSRALVMNQNNMAQGITKSAKEGGKWNTLPWDTLFDSMNAALEKVAQGHPDVLGNFLASIGHSVSNIVQKAADTGVRHTLVTLGVVSKRPVVELNFSGTYREFREFLINQVMKTANVQAKAVGAKTVKSTNIFRKAMAETAKGFAKAKGFLAEAETDNGILPTMEYLSTREQPMMESKGSVQLHIVAGIDVDELNHVLEKKGGTYAEKAQEIAKTVRTTEQLKKLELEAWHKKINVAGAMRKIGKGVPLVGNLLSGFCQISMCVTFGKKLTETSKAAGYAENGARLTSATLGLAATGAEIIIKGTWSLTKVRLSAGGAVLQEETAETMEARLAPAAKWLGIAGIAIGVLADIAAAYEAYEAHNIPLAITKAVSAAAGIVLIVSILKRVPVLGFIAGIFLFGAAIVETLLPEPIETWLKGCCFGIKPDGNLNTEEKSMNALNQAIGA